MTNAYPKMKDFALLNLTLRFTKMVSKKMSNKHFFDHVTSKSKIVFSYGLYSVMVCEITANLHFRGLVTREGHFTSKSLHTDI